MRNDLLVLNVLPKYWIRDNYQRHPWQRLLSIQLFAFTVILMICTSPCIGQVMKGLMVVIPTLNTNEVVVVAATPQEYGAVGDGITDDSGAFQAAMNAVYNSGGGVVYAPAGDYAFYTNLTIPTGVTLHGDWQDWTTGTNGLVGTTFKVYYGAGNTNASPFINMDSTSALKDCNIWYPNQNPNSITPYPYSIAVNLQELVQNVVLVNSYMGIYAVGSSYYKLITIIGTPLFIGYYGNNNDDVNHSADIRFNPNIWAISKLTNAPSAGGAYATWIKANGTGMLMGSSVTLQSVDTEISGYNIGVNIQGGGSIFYEGWITNCDTAVQLVSGSGQEFSGFTLEGNVAINHVEAANDGTLELSHCTIIGTSGTAVTCAGQSENSQMQFQTCTISNTLNLTGPGMLNLVDCSLSGSTQCVMSASATKAAFTGCTFSPSQKIVNNGTPGNLLVDSRQSISNAFPVVHWTNIASANLCLPAKTNLYVATSYGATGNGVTDDTAAINAALTAAGNNGGGIVYLPAGSYYTSTTLTVPGGVRLQGIAEGLAPQYGGTMIEPHGGQGTTNGPPAVVLDANSGLWGVDIWYPAQNSNSIAFPPTIQGQGGNIYVVGVFSPNPYIYIDFDTYTCTNHFVGLNYGWALYREFVVGNGSSGAMANNQLEGIFTEFSESQQPISLNYVVDYMQVNTLGNCAETVANCFCYGTHAMLYTFAEGGKGPTATLINATQDGSSGGFLFDSAAASTINVVNQNAAIWGQADISEAAATVIASTTNFTGTARFFNAEDWSCGTVVDINGGDIGLEMYQQTANGNPSFLVNGGVFHLINLNTGNDGSPETILFGPNAGLPGKTNEFIGSFADYGFNLSFNSLTTPYAIWNNYSLNSSAVWNLGPVAAGDFYPNGAYQFQASPALTFQAASANGINASGITVQLMGTNLLGQSYVSNYTSANGLIIGGSSTARTVSAPLAANTIYSVVTIVTDASGNSATNMVPYFDTISPAYTFEAEDFDYTNGNYINNPQTNAYAGLSGVAGIDYSNSLIGTGSASYRPQGLETEGDSDIPRLAYSGVLQDYDVGYNYGGDGNWGNYTRLFPAGTYYVFMRSANGPTSDSESMYQVTAGRGTANQTLNLLGTFSAVNTGGWQTYAWVPLLNSSGGLATFIGGSVETLRVTTVNGGNNINCYMLVPTNDVSYLLYVSGSILEAENATLTGGAAVTTDHTGYSGTGFVGGYYESTTADTKFDVNIASAGRYTLAVRYSAGNGTSSNTALYVNGIFITNLICNATADWNTWAFENQQIALNGGANTIELKSSASVAACINLDYITLTSLAPPPLSIQSASGAQGLTLEWPDNGNADVSSQTNLYYTSSLVAPVVWTLVTNTPVLSNGQWMVNLPVGTNSAGFYGLQ
jgi:hypothetical protein